jgi:cytochrome c oxidase subunit 3
MPSEILEERAHSGGRGPLESLPLVDGGGSPEIFGDPTRFGLWAFMGTVCMLFIGFTSAYILRRSSADWRPLAPPLLLWLNTAVLLTSSLTIEGARKRLRGWELRAVRSWVAATGLLGALFVVGQIGAWKQLAAQGVFLASNPHSSFFYVLTGVHIVHLLGGLCWFGVVFSKVRRMAYTPGEDGLGLFATYWHFLAALWIYLLFLLFVF